MREQGWGSITQGSVVQGLQHTKLPGRLQVCPMSVLTVAEHIQTAFSMPALVSSVGEQEHAAGKQQSRLAALSEVVNVSTYVCVRCACSLMPTGRHLDSTKAFASAQCV